MINELFPQQTILYFFVWEQGKALMRKRCQKDARDFEKRRWWPSSEAAAVRSLWRKRQFVSHERGKEKRKHHLYLDYRGDDKNTKAKKKDWGVIFFIQQRVMSS